MEKTAPKMREACKRTDLSQDLGPGYRTPVPPNRPGNAVIYLTLIETERPLRSFGLGRTVLSPHMDFAL